ncbi:hypothetical protein FML15_22890 [Klebsiella michiganensis]|uniref:hypothetical protein n=1 Tax=Klebsiella michiganensis TaxID=1134687 RepID=UPI001CCD1A8B|nr:hypothetical protein [Klebsiella michiganensis]ELC0840559.1 hypothetical protein [Klebsiella michiganensis]MBZ7580124.1 hypothetical protein [Klebsiella michiganensis]
MTTDITELAQRMRNYLDMAIKSGVKLSHLTTDELSGLLDGLGAAQARIADLESRTVKIPYLPDDCDRTEAHYKYQAALRDAGIKVEAE